MNADFIIRAAIIHTRKIVTLLQQRGLIFVIRLFATLIFGYYFYKIFKSGRTFLFNNTRHKYFYHYYNVTWASERAIEIPIIRSIIERGNSKRILEFGNVLSYYFPTNHAILDKYEKGKNIINQDVADFHPSDKYDLIVSISTIEHIGWDEHLQYSGPEPQKIFLAFDNLKKCLKPNGEMFITFPIGYNPELDRMLDSGRLKLTRLKCMKRVSADNVWCEAKWHDIRNALYDDPYISANGLVIGYYKRRTCS